MCVYLRVKLEVSGIILTSFRKGGSFTPPPPSLPPQNEPLKRLVQIRVKYFQLSFTYVHLMLPCKYSVIQVFSLLI